MIVSAGSARHCSCRGCCTYACAVCPAPCARPTLWSTSTVLHVAVSELPACMPEHAYQAESEPRLHSRILACLLPPSHPVGHPWSALRPSDRHVEHGVHPGRALHRAAHLSRCRWRQRALPVVQLSCAAVPPPPPPPCSIGCHLRSYPACVTPAGEDEREQLACIMELLGAPPRALVQAAPRANLFFDTSAAGWGGGVWWGRDDCVCGWSAEGSNR